MSSYRDSLEKYLKILEVKTDSCLDVGGASFPVSGRVKSWSVDEYKIMDNCLEKDTEKEHWQEPDYVGDIQEEGDIQWDVFKDRCIWDKSMWPEPNYNFKGFDLIFCLEVAEYWFDPLTALKNIKKLLTENGKLIISLPTNYPVHNPMIHDYLRYTEFGIYKLMEETGFEIEDMIPRNAYHPNLLSDFYKAEGLHPAKHYSHHDCLGFICIARRKK